MTNLLTYAVAILVIAAIVLALKYHMEDLHSRYDPAAHITESYTSTPEGAKITETGLGITGPVIYTNQLTNGDPMKIMEQVRTTGKATDESCIMMGTRNNKSSLDNALAKQLKVHAIQAKGNNGFQQIEDLKEISKEIAHDSSVKGMFSRDGGASAKLIIDKYATVGIIDQKYMPNRDRPKELRAVGTAIMMPGFAFDATKALDSAGTGICPTGGVRGVVGIERHKKKTTGLMTVANAGAASGGAIGGEAPEQTKLDETLKSNNVLTAGEVSGVLQETPSEIVTTPTEDETAIMAAPETTPEGNVTEKFINFHY
jgi:hypothetical protein